MLSRSVSILLGIALSRGAVVLVAGQDEARLGTEGVQKPAGILSLDEILQRVKTQRAGRVVETELERKRGRYVYEIDVIGDDGVKKEFKYDANTGALLSSKAEDAEEED